MELHPDERVIFEGHPSWRATLGFYIKGLAVALLAAGIAALVTAIGDGVDGAVVGLVAVVGLALVVVAGFLKRMATVYTITNQRLRIKRGLVARKVQQTRIDRVQNVNTDQSVLERLLRVGTVDFDTAGSDDSEFKFVGVASPAEVVDAVERAQSELPAGAGVDPGPPPTTTTP
jgi:uncharacterized membrane protein YdbT with pleckstrin-like domain